MKAAPRESEAGFTRAVLDLAKLHGWRAMHQRPAMTAKGWRTAISGDAGFPDLVLVRGTRLIFAELKSATGKVAPAQTEWLIRLMGAGAECYIWKPKDWPEIVAKLSPACDGSAAVNGLSPWHPHPMGSARESMDSSVDAVNVQTNDDAPDVAIMRNG